MKITEIISANRPSLSFEVFPPKTSNNLESVMEVTKKIAELNPSYMSVTYGAGGGTSEYTAYIAQSLAKMNVTPLAHLTCISSSRSHIHALLDDLHEKGIENILALRGDIPDGWDASASEYKYSKRAYFRNT